MTPQTAPQTPLARRIAAVQQPKPEPWKPAWMRNLQAKDMSGRLPS